MILNKIRVIKVDLNLIQEVTAYVMSVKSVIFGSNEL